MPNHHDIVMVDDSDAELELAQACYELSNLSNPWRAFTSASRFLAHLAEVRTGSSAMPALVLLDINMPEMNGFEVLEAARADPYFASQLSFVVLTNSENPEDRERAYALGVAGFQVKPDSVDDYVRFFDSLG